MPAVSTLHLAGSCCNPSLMRSSHAYILTSTILCQASWPSGVSATAPTLKELATWRGDGTGKVETLGRKAAVSEPRTVGVASRGSDLGAPSTRMMKTRWRGGVQGCGERHPPKLTGDQTACRPG